MPQGLLNHQIPAHLANDHPARKIIDGGITTYFFAASPPPSMWIFQPAAAGDPNLASPAPSVNLNESLSVKTAIIKLPSRPSTERSSAAIIFNLVSGCDRYGNLFHGSSLLIREISLSLIILAIYLNIVNMLFNIF
jgi:hypothetical protein